MAARTLSQLEQAAQRAQARHAAAQERLDAARQAVLDRAWEHHAAVVGQLNPPPPAPAARSARAAVVAKNPIAVAQQRIADALAEYERIARELGVA